jgi:hypothetical protein
MERATSERIVKMRVELIIDEGIVRIRFTFLSPGGPREKRTEKRGEEMLSGVSTPGVHIGVNVSSI